MERIKEIRWTPEAIEALQIIYGFHFQNAPQSADRLIDEIVNHSSGIVFPEQYQQDEINPDYRRIIIWHYKILYRFENGIVFIVQIFDSRQNPSDQAL